MSIAALIVWILTALGGLTLLAIWLAGGGLRQQPTHLSRFRAPVVFGHMGLAALGLILWILYMTLNTVGWGWGALIAAVAAAVLGLLMFTAWRASGGLRSTASPRITGLTPGQRAAARTGGMLGTEVPAEHRFPVALVAGHGLLAALTILLVLLVLLTPL